jgi:hypothetical protein
MRALLNWLERTMQKAVRTRMVHATSVGLVLAAVFVLPGCTASSTCSNGKITTESLPDATVGVAYSFTLSHSCAGSGASWELADGELPPGITLSWDGHLSGTPTAAGSFSFRVMLTLTSRGWGATTYTSGSDSRAYALTVR